ncbi:MAG TPA: efflux RND transporter periplasmic adaptor subunit [Planctomycetia bacterium]|nr:efflux RND transporter periplasmic adaptor subunit [Planctomycetia bacterium]
MKSLRLPPPARRRGGTSPAWFLAAALALVAGYLGYRQDNPPNAAAQPAPPDPADKNGSTNAAASSASPSNKSAKDAAPAAKAGTVVLESKGYIIAKYKILVSPKVAGVVERLFIDEGQTVKKGDVLAVLETEDYRFERDRAAGLHAQAAARSMEMEAGYQPEEVQQAQAELDESKANLVQLDSNHKRNLQLRRSSTLAASELEQSEALFRAMQAKVRKLEKNLQMMTRGYREEKKMSARAEMAQMKADLDRAQWRLDNCTIKSPISGVVLSKKAEMGNLVNPIAFSGSQALCEMADLTDLEVDLYIQERDFSKVYDGQRCRVTPEAFPEREYYGTARRMPIGDRSKGAVPVRVSLKIPAEEAGVYLRPDMGAVTAFLAGETAQGEPKGAKAAPESKSKN